MTGAIPEWAYNEAASRCNKGNSKPLTALQWRYHVSFNELAKCIADHEEPPVDPIVLEARAICVRFWEGRGSKAAAAQYRRGDHDGCGGPSMSIAVAALRRGIELAQSTEEPKP